MANRDIEARLILKAIDHTGNVLERIGSRLSDVDRRAQSFNRSQGLMAQGASAFNRALVTGIASYATVATVRSLYTNFAAVERTLNRIAINAGEGRQAVDEMMATINRTSHDFAMSQEEVTAGFETLIAAGQDYREAMAFLPAVTATAQASGAAVEDIANSALAVSRNFGIASGAMQSAFDILDTGGKQGMFELRDMAQYLPSLAPAFHALGYEGLDGLRKLTAMLQTVRLQTGDASSAATNLQNVFQKMETSQTVSNFAKFGIDLQEQMAKARRDGKDLLDTFVQLSIQATKGDLSKLPQLFTDLQMQQGMRALIQGQEAYARFLVDLQNTDGSTLKDLNQVLGDTQATIDRLGSSWETFKRSLGGFLGSAGITGGLNFLSRSLDYEAALDRGAEKLGYTGLQGRLRYARDSFGDGSYEAYVARAGGWAPDDASKQVMATAPAAYVALGRLPSRPFVPTPGAAPLTPAQQAAADHATSLGFTGNSPAEQAYARELKASGDEAGQKVGQAMQKGGQDAGQTIGDEIRQAGADVANSISSAIGGAWSRIRGDRRVNADVGRSGDYVFHRAH